MEAMNDTPYQNDHETKIAQKLYDFSGYHVPRSLIEAVLQVKIACARKNHELHFLSAEELEAIESACRYFAGLDDDAFKHWFSLDAFQGGAGTSTNMMVNEAISMYAKNEHSLSLSPLSHINLHTSTNDVMPTALKLALWSEFESLEKDLAHLQTACQSLETQWAHIDMVGHTELQDAVPIKAGRIAATWAAAVSRDRWRTMKSLERLKEVNLGGTAIGTGSGAPRSFTLTVIKELQSLTKIPLARAEDAVEATSNYDCLVEAMTSLQIAAVNMIRIAQDIRLLSSGPTSGMGLVKLPKLLKGSTIMPGKINPVIAELCIQAGDQVLANHALLASTAAKSELELNAFFPLIAHLCFESQRLLKGSICKLTDYLGALGFDSERAKEQLAKSHSSTLTLSPLFGYLGVEKLVSEAKSKELSLSQYVLQLDIFEQEDLAWIFAPASLGSFGYDEKKYQELSQKYGAKINSYLRNPS